MMILISAETGRVEAVLLDNGYLTDVRTALAGAVAADRLARADARVAGIIGTGLQARLQLEALRLVRPVERALLWGRDPAKAEAPRASWKRARPAGRRGVGRAGRPRGRHRRHHDGGARALGPGRLAASGPAHHGDGLGRARQAGARSQVLGRADRVVVDRRSQCERLGELRSALAAGTVRPDRPIDELGEIVAGLKPGRRSAGEITVCDLTGTGVQDTAIAIHALRATTV